MKKSKQYLKKARHLPAVSCSPQPEPPPEMKSFMADQLRQHLDAQNKKKIKPSIDKTHS